MDRGAWEAAVHGIAKSWTRLSDFTFFHLITGLSSLLDCELLEGRNHAIFTAEFPVPWVGTQIKFAEWVNEWLVESSNWSPMNSRGLSPPTDIPGLPRWLSGKESTYQCRRSRTCRIQFPCWEDPLEEEMATHSSILAWKNSWSEEAGRLQSMGLQGVEHDLATEHEHMTSLPMGQKE